MKPTAPGSNKATDRGLIAPEVPVSFFFPMGRACVRLIALVVADRTCDLEYFPESKVGLGVCGATGVRIFDRPRVGKIVGGLLKGPRMSQSVR